MHVRVSVGESREYRALTIGHIAASRPPDRTRRSTVRPFASRDLGLILGALLAAGGVVVGSTMLSNSIPWAPYIPLGLVALGLAGWVVLAAIYASPTAIMLYFGVVMFVTDGVFRLRAPGDNSLDWQSFLKFLLWLGAGVIGFAHMPPIRQLLARPACACWLAYICVALASAIYSPTPAYSFAAALAVFCLFAFAFTLTRHLSEGQILWTMLISLTIFNIGGWIVFYAVPDLGISEGELIADLTFGQRMAGLAGQANNLGSVCSVAVGAAFVLWYTGRAKPMASSHPRRLRFRDASEKRRAYSRVRDGRGDRYGFGLSIGVADDGGRAGGVTRHPCASGLSGFGPHCRG